MNTFSNLRVALVYDRVNTPYGGAEQVLLSLRELFPTAPLFTSVYEPKKAPWAVVFTVIPSFVQNIPILNTQHRLIPWLMPIAYEQMNLDEFDVIISVSSAEAKGVLTKPHQLHICYLLTPTRYLYSHAQEYTATIPLLLRPFAKLFSSYLRWWDQVAISRPDVLIPISELVKSRITEYHAAAEKRVTEVIYPPIQIQSLLEKKQHAKALQPKEHIEQGEYLLCFGRLVSYKKFDAVLRVAAQTNQKLIIIGDGPQKKHLQQLSLALQANCTFHDHVPDAKLFEYIQNAKAVIFPAAEDFGISQVEVAAIGTPLILHTKSGAAEILKELQHVILLQEMKLSALKKAILLLDDLPLSATMNIESLIKYDVSSFKDNIKKRIEIEYNRYRKGLYEYT
jgi:glycosyltransferase involved in cell wall biosynthesis